MMDSYHMWNWFVILVLSTADNPFKLSNIFPALYSEQLYIDQELKYYFHNGEQAVIVARDGHEWADQLKFVTNIG